MNGKTPGKTQVSTSLANVGSSRGLDSRSKRLSTKLYVSGGPGKQ